MRKILALFMLLFVFCAYSAPNKEIIIPIIHPASQKKKDYRDENAHKVIQANKHSSNLPGKNVQRTADGGGYIDGKYPTPQEIEQILAYVASHYTAENGPMHKAQNAGIKLISHEPCVQNQLIIEKPQPHPFEEKRSAVRVRSTVSMKAIDKEIDFCRKTRGEKRWRALQHSKEREAYAVKKYELTVDGKKLYKRLQYDVRLRPGFDVTPRHSTASATAGERRYDTCYGNQFQQILYEEFVDIINEAGDIHYATGNRELQDITSNVAEFSGIGSNYLDEGFVKEALLISNFCWSMLDCCVAAGEGVVEGFKNTAHMIVHPVQTVQNLGHAAVHAGRCLGKVLKILIAEHDLCITDPEEFARRWRSRIGRIQTVIVALEDKWQTTPTRDIIKSIATVGTEMVLMNELAVATGQFLTGARNKALQVAESFEREAEVVLAVTAEGIPLEVRVAEEATMHFMEGAAQRVVMGSSHLSFDEFVLAVRQIVNLEPDLDRLRKMFDMTRKGFGEMANKYIKLAYEHYLAPELSASKKGVIEFTGFHHDLHQALEKSGLLQLTDKVTNEFGVYSAKVWCYGKAVDKTLFPAHWSREKVIGKIMEAYDNFITAGATNYAEKGGKYIVRGRTSEGIMIEMYITKNGKITTAYPKISSYNL